MNDNQRRSGPRFTPDTARQWTLALYPAAVLFGATYMIVTNKPITGEIIGLFIGLLSAGSLQVAVKKNGDKNVESDNSGGSGGSVHRSGGEKLEYNDRSWADYFDRWRDRYFGLRSREVRGLSV